MKIWPFAFLLYIVISIYATVVIVAAVYAQHGLMATVATFLVPGIAGWITMQVFKTEERR